MPEEIEEELRKFGDLQVMKNSSYFEDAEPQSMPYMFSNLSWEEAKLRVLQAIQTLEQYN